MGKPIRHLLTSSSYLYILLWQFYDAIRADCEDGSISLGRVTFEWFSSVELAPCNVGEDASFGRRGSFGDAFLGVPEDTLAVVPGDVFLETPVAEDLSPPDLTRRLSGGRGVTGDLGERPFGRLPLSGEGVLGATSSKVISCLPDIVASGDLASPLLTARGVTMGVATWRTLVGVEGGGWGWDTSTSLAFEPFGGWRSSSTGVRACNHVCTLFRYIWRGGMLIDR